MTAGILRWTTLALMAGTAIAFIPRHARAADAPRAPLVVFEQGRSMTTSQVDAVVQGLASPVLRQGELRRHLKLPAPVSSAVLHQFELQFLEAEDAFFDGAHSRAQELFTVLIDQSAPLGDDIARSPELAALVFKALIRCAEIARAEKDETTVALLLERAAVRFVTMSPAPRDFPTWVRDRFAAIHERSVRRDGVLLAELEQDCTLVLDGALVPESKELRALARGVHVVQARCHDRTGPAQPVVIGAIPLVVRPLGLRAAAILDGSLDFTLSVDSRATREALEADAKTIARAAGASRIVAIIAGDASIEIAFFDAEREGPVRAEVSLSPEPAPLAAAAALLVQSPALPRVSPLAFRPWYKNGAAWAFVLIGAATLASGVGLAISSGHPSTLEPLGFGLTAAGATGTLTGAVLFFFPGRDSMSDIEVMPSNTKTLGKGP